MMTDYAFSVVHAERRAIQALVLATGALLAQYGVGRVRVPASDAARAALIVCRSRVRRDELPYRTLCVLHAACLTRRWLVLPHPATFAFGAVDACLIRARFARRALIHLTRLRARVVSASADATAHAVRRTRVVLVLATRALRATAGILSRGIRASRARLAHARSKASAGPALTAVALGDSATFLSRRAAIAHLRGAQLTCHGVLHRRKTWICAVLGTRRARATGCGGSVGADECAGSACPRLETAR